jgi:hypothetical protein
MAATTNNLSVIDTRAESLNKFDWTVMGTIYADDDDMDGTDILEGFDVLDIALNFVRNTLE